ncbi:MAG: kelch repeat-containing protein [bacterium]
MASNICNWTGPWSPTSDLDVAREAHTATVLKNGKVLVCGGVAAGATVGTTLLYNPATGTYASAGSLTVARHGHQATRLKDGNVLVTGGFSVGTGQLASAELYNWLAGTWSLLPAQMSSRRQDHTATLTNNGDVLLVGGFGGTAAFSVILDTIELYILTSSTFVGLIHRMQVPRMGHTATMQENGAILVAGGQDSQGPVKKAETYHPSHPPFNPVSDMSTPRAGHTATLLPGLGVLLAGGAGPVNNSGSGYVIQSTTEIFDGTHFSSVGSMSAARASHVAVDLGDGRVLICGGEDASGPVASAELYDSGLRGFVPAGTTGTARARAAAASTSDGGALVCGGRATAVAGSEVRSSELFDPMFRGTKGSLPEARERFTVTRLGIDNALLIGGRNFSGVPSNLAAVLRYAGATQTFTQTGSIATQRYDHTATLLIAPNQILIVGGSSPAGQSLQSAELFDLINSWVVPGGQPVAARAEHTATVLPGGKVLIVGGALAGTPLATAELYDPATNTFTATGSMTYGRFGHSASVLPNGTVLVCGGMSTDSLVPGGTGITFTTEIYDPTTGAFTLQPQPNRLQVNRAFHTVTALANGKMLFAGGLSVGIQATNKAELYDPASNSFAQTGAMADHRYRHTATLTAMPNGQVMMVGGLTTYSGPASKVVELFDPTTGTFVRTGDLAHARSDHAAVLTSLQQVLVIGGRVLGDDTSAEISKPTDCGVTSSSSGSSCFIATAAYGSEMHPQVERLREYRDAVLMRSAGGRLFVRVYYRCSPPVAAVVRRSETLRSVVRYLLK